MELSLNLDHGTWHYLLVCINISHHTFVVRYEEDVFVHNHTSVWGSWWSNGQWGYACCHQVIRNSYCTGEKGKELEAESVVAREIDEKAQTTPNPMQNHEGMDLWGSEAPEGELDAKLVETSRKKMQQKRKLADMDEKDRAYNSLSGEKDDVTQADMEAYRLEKRHASDPLRAMETAKHTQESKDYGFV